MLRFTGIEKIKNRDDLMLLLLKNTSFKCVIGYSITLGNDPQGVGVKGRENSSSNKFLTRSMQCKQFSFRVLVIVLNIPAGNTLRA